MRFIRGCSYIDSPDWLKKRKPTMNPENIANKCFQFEATVELLYEEIESYLERVQVLNIYQ